MQTDMNWLTQVTKMTKTGLRLNNFINKIVILCQYNRLLDKQFGKIQKQIYLSESNLSDLVQMKVKQKLNPQTQDISDKTRLQNMEDTGSFRLMSKLNV